MNSELWDKQNLRVLPTLRIKKYNFNLQNFCDVFLNNYWSQIVFKDQICTKSPNKNVKIYI